MKNRSPVSAGASIWLRTKVHLEAFASEPLHYLQAVAWAARGLKLRSRNAFALLKGGTRDAYALWIATREPARDSAFARTKHSSQTICIVVDARSAADGLDATVASARKAIAKGGGQCEVVILGREYVQEGIVTASNPKSLAEQLRLHADPADGRVPVIAIKAGDQLSGVALVAYRSSIKSYPTAEVIYADDDLIDQDGRRNRPHFKPDWNSELARHHDFVTDSCLFRCSPDRVGDDWPMSAIRTEKCPVHVPHVLHHRRARPSPVVPMPAASSPGTIPHVSIVIPTRDQAGLLRTCIDGLFRCELPSFDITVIDNDSRETKTLDLFDALRTEGVAIVPHPGPFNYAAMHNAVLDRLQGPLLCLLNNDVEPLDPHWLGHLAKQAVRHDVGAVGAQLLYPDGSIQHAGVVTGIGGAAAHAHRFGRPEAEGYFFRAQLPQFVSAVTGACMVVAREKFIAAGGFDDENFAVAFNDVDLCLRLNSMGWQSFYEPRARLIHHESVSRGLDRHGAKKARFESELRALKRKWGTDRNVDPFHHPELSPFSENFVIRL